MSARSDTPGPALLLQFMALAAAWGASFLLIKIGLEGLAPTQVVLGRLLCGAAALAVICAATGHHLPHGLATWCHLAVVGALLCVVPFLLFAWAELHISSGLASIYNATTPLMTMLVAIVALRVERPTRPAVAGLAVGFLGVLLVLGPWRGVGGGEASAQAACLLATASYGLAFVYLRRYVSPLRLHAIPVATVQVGLATAQMGLAAPWVATQPVTLTPASLPASPPSGSSGPVWRTYGTPTWSPAGARPTPPPSPT